jgi:hypothetical protein
MTGRAQPILDGELRTMLRDLLSDADANGQLDPEHFWGFVAGLAQGRGIGDGLHTAGMKSLNDEPASPAKTLKNRQRRAYHLGLLIQFLAETGGRPGSPSVLPGNFNSRAIMADLAGMIGTPGGVPASAPQILYATRKGDALARKGARQRIVGVVLWRAGHSGESALSCWYALMGTSAENAEKDQWQRWLREFGGSNGSFGSAAFASGQRGDTLSPYAASDADLVPTVALANSGPGSRMKK